MLVFKNKSDVSGSMSEDEVRQVSSAASARYRSARLTFKSKALDLDSIKTHRWKIMACSAMTGLNLDTGLAFVVEDAKERLFLF